jgi:hypothetical protein
MYLQQVGWDMVWIDLAQDRGGLRGFVSAEMDLGIP